MNSIPDLSAVAYYVPFALLILLVTALKHLYVFHDEYLAKRRFKRLSYLREEAVGNPELVDFVDQARQELVFSGVLGRSASPRLSEAVMELYRTRLVAIWELKYVRFYIKVQTDGSIDVAPGKGGIFLAAVCLLLALCIVFYFGPLIIALVALKTIPALGAALGVLLGVLVMGFTMLKEVLEIAIAFRIQRQLRAHRAAGFHVSLLSQPFPDELPNGLVEPQSNSTCNFGS